MGKKTQAHFLVARTATALAHAEYEKLMQDNTRYANWKSICPDLTPDKLEKMFVKEMAPLMVEAARKVLASMLERPIAESMKLEIAEALMLDSQVRRYVDGSAVH